MPTGTSIKGSQILDSGASGVSTVYLLVSPNSASPPQRAGFIYIVATDSSFPFGRTVIYRGTLYSPGLYTSIGIPPGGEDSLVEVIVAWNRAGLEWDIALY